MQGVAFRWWITAGGRRAGFPADGHVCSWGVFGSVA